MKVIKLPFGLKTIRRFQFPRKLGILNRLYGRVLARHGVCWVNTSTGLDWKLDLNNFGHRWLVFGDYEGTAQVNWIRNWLSNGGMIVDSGANIGQTLIYFLNSPGTEILCVEPVGDCVDWLSECVKFHSAGHRVTITNALFDESQGVTELKVAGSGDSAEWSTVNTEWFGNLDTKVVECKAITFDSLMKQQNVSSVRLWKLDVEGGEYRALSGALKSLEKQVVEALLVEVHPDNSESVNELMNRFGYTAYKIQNNGVREINRADIGEDLAGNCLFLPKTPNSHQP